MCVYRKIHRNRQMASSDRDGELSQNRVRTHRFAEGRTQASPSSGMAGSTPPPSPGNPHLFVGLGASAEVPPVRSLVSGAVFRSVSFYGSEEEQGEEKCTFPRGAAGKRGALGRGHDPPGKAGRRTPERTAKGPGSGREDTAAGKVARPPSAAILGACYSRSRAKQNQNNTKR